MWLNFYFLSQDCLYVLVKGAVHFLFHNGGAFLFFYFVEWNKRDCNGIGEIFKMYYNLFFNSLIEKKCLE